MGQALMTAANTQKHRRPFGAFFSHLSRLSHGVNALCEVALFISILLMVGLTSLQIVCRYFFTALTWSEELTRFLLVFASLLGASVGFKKGGHIAITALRDKLPSRVSLGIYGITQGVGVCFFAILAWYGGKLTISEAGQLSPGMGLSMMWVYAMYPLMGAVVVLHMVASFFESFGEV